MKRLSTVDKTAKMTVVVAGNSPMHIMKRGKVNGIALFYNLFWQDENIDLSELVKKSQKAEKTTSEIVNNLPQGKDIKVSSANLYSNKQRQLFISVLLDPLVDISGDLYEQTGLIATYDPPSK